MNMDERWSGGGPWLGGFVAVLTALSISACESGPGREMANRALTEGAVTWPGQEMLGRPTDHSVTVKAIADQAVEVHFEYGPYDGDYTNSTVNATYSTSTSGLYIVEAVIDGLSANTHYKYRMRYRAAGDTADFVAGADHGFHTQRAEGATFVFAIQSDSHMGYAAFYDDQVYSSTMTHIEEEHPDFVFDLGDFVSLDDPTEDETSAQTKYMNQRAMMEGPGKSAAIFLVLGNHENEEGWNLDDFGPTNQAASLPVLGANGRKRYFVNPVPNGFYSGDLDTSVAEIDGDHLRGDYYAFAWGNALFVAIDPYWYTLTKPYQGALGGEKNDETVIGTRWDWSLGKAQYDWLKSTLENSKAPLKFVFSHQPVGGVDSASYGRGGALAAVYCEMGGMNIDGKTSGWNTNRAGWAQPIHQLFVDNHVTAFFHGHDHVYAKETKDGVVYQEVPMAAFYAPNDDNTGFADNSTTYKGATLIPNSGHLRVTVSPAGATVAYIRSSKNASLDGTTQTSYDLPGCTGDSDGDGATDCYDQCPADAKKTAPGQCGCGAVDTDTDGDSVADCKDGCPSDPQKTAAGVCGCGVADTDTDADGVPDCNDGCPNDPKKAAAGVCGCGVADTDTDADGTADCNDGCPSDKNKIAPGVCGCGVADTDTDGDGTLDCNDGCPQDPNKTSPGLCGCGATEISCTDLCPSDPNKTNPGQCGCGVADTDTDGDGTADCNDACPADKLKTAPGACGCGVVDVDGDGDGTPDCNDACPADKLKTAPGACGCGVVDVDGDGDGTPDCSDACPADKLKTAPGACGCGAADTDSDEDGTADCNDQCPSDAHKTAPDTCGCGVADTDADGDGVADCNDQCASDKNKVAPGACGCGVADIDTDEDGTLDCDDHCPNDALKTAPGVCGCGSADTDANGNGTIDCQETNCSVGACSCDGVTLTSDDSDNSAVVGTTIRFTASATCTGGAASYQFRLLKSTSTWKPIKTWSSVRSLDWQTTGLAPGMYWIQVWARGASSPKTFDSSAMILFKLRES
jgi:hypothetical protein